MRKRPGPFGQGVLFLSTEPASIIPPGLEEGFKKLAETGTLGIPRSWMGLTYF